MTLKKVTSMVTALVCCAGMAAIMPELPLQVQAYTAVENSFEVNYGGWYGNADSVVLTAEEGAGYNGSRGMIVTGRTDAQDGASSSKGFYLSGNTAYHYSVWVKSETDEQFHFGVLCKNEDTGEETTEELVCKTVNGGEWTELSADYTAPKDSYEFKLTLRTDSTSDFQFDEVRITTQKSLYSV